MNFDDYDALAAEARPEPPFSCGTERDEWIARTCRTCIHDREQRTDPVSGPGCPLPMIALVAERTPIQWFATDGPDLWRCIEYRHENDGPGPEPQPVPDPPGQLVLAPREPFEGVRMLTPLDPDLLPAVLRRHAVTDGP
ncbi:hypothetical protein RM780_04240 [Streptomyces sp. DSM 44917]|uniref:Uncharacterized protein n=1 Tax=Streptomyces boetiae TaxID=3075541 RepID=A0ABU2L481_9ACTN|nr:hypothetical protein [Streptomyces sp. DSM 44917]MDT0306172.1 hypothetical protein [Streptomyces sp. DSM 44917]